MKDLAAELKKLRKKIKQSIEKEVKDRSRWIWNEHKKTMPYIGVAYWMLQTPAINKIITEKINKSKDPVETWYQEVLVGAWKIYNRWLTEDQKRFSEKIALEQIEVYERGVITKERRLTGDDYADILKEKKKPAILERPDKTGKSAGTIAERLRPHTTYTERMGRNYERKIEDVLDCDPEVETIAERIKRCRYFTEKKGYHAGHKTKKIPLGGAEARDFKYRAWELGYKIRILYCETHNIVYGWEPQKRQSYTFQSLSHYYRRADEADDYIPSPGESLLYDDSEDDELPSEFEQYEVVKDQLIDPLLSELEGKFPIPKLRRQVQIMIRGLTTPDERAMLKQHLAQELTNEKIGLIRGMSKEGVRKALLRIKQGLVTPLEKLEIVRDYVIWKRGKRLAKRDFPHWPWGKK